MGGSHGGTTTRPSMADPGNGRSLSDRFAAAVALYPACGIQLGDWRVERLYGSGKQRVEYRGVYIPLAPLLILIGEEDDWTPAEPCRRLAECAQHAGHLVKIKIYPGAHHSFDSARPVRYAPERVNANSPSGRGATTAGDPEAWADSIDQVARFFGQHLLRGAN
jgi:dienelactone hydrolase